MESRGIEVAMVGERANAVLYLINQDGEAYTKDMETVTCKVIHNSTGEELNCIVNKPRGNEYEISYQTTS